jgi:hypothetical protein
MASGDLLGHVQFRREEVLEAEGPTFEKMARVSLTHGLLVASGTLKIRREESGSYTETVKITNLQACGLNKIDEILNTHNSPTRAFIIYLTHIYLHLFFILYIIIDWALQI